MFLLYVRQIWNARLTKAFFLWALSFFNSKRFCHSHLRCCSFHEEGTSFWILLVPWKVWGFWFLFSIGFTSFSATPLFSLSLTVLYYVQNFRCYAIYQAIILMYVFYIDDTGLQIPGLQICANTSSWLLNLNPTLDIL